MQEIFFTILVVWVLFRIFGASAKVKTFTFNTQHNYHQTQEQQDDGKVKVKHVTKETNKKNEIDKGEYVDFEEVKD